MRFAVLGEGRETLFESNSWPEIVRWTARYIRDENAGGWDWFQFRKDGKVYDAEL